MVSLVAAAFLFVAVVYAAIQIHRANSARRSEKAKQLPGIKATINKTPSLDGWRSIQLHLTPPASHVGNFDFKRSGWRIKSAELRFPRKAEIAFAREDDHSLRGPIAAPSARLMSRRIDDIQPYTMEFFIRFPKTPKADHGNRAKFRVKTWRKKPLTDGPTLEVWAEVPLGALIERHDT